MTMTQSDIEVYAADRSYPFQMQILLGCWSSQISHVDRSMPRVRSRPSAENRRMQEPVERMEFLAKDQAPARLRQTRRRRRNLRGMGPSHWIQRAWAATRAG